MQSQLLRKRPVVGVKGRNTRLLPIFRAAPILGPTIEVWEMTRRPNLSIRGHSQLCDGLPVPFRADKHNIPVASSSSVSSPVVKIWIGRPTSLGFSNHFASV